MSSLPEMSVTIQTSSTAIPSTPSWFGEVALVASHLRKQGILNKICERVRFARRRFGKYDVLDFVTLQDFYEAVGPFASADHWPCSDDLAYPQPRRSVAF